MVHGSCRCYISGPRARFLVCMRPMTQLPLIWASCPLSLVHMHGYSYPWPLLAIIANRATPIARVFNNTGAPTPLLLPMNVSRRSVVSSFVVTLSLSPFTPGANRKRTLLRAVTAFRAVTCRTSRTSLSHHRIFAMVVTHRARGATPRAILDTSPLKLIFYVQDLTVCHRYPDLP